MNIHPTEKKPTWWQLYALGGLLVGWVALIDTSVASDTARLALELAAVTTVSLFILGWVRINRGRIEPVRAQRTCAAVAEPALSTSTAAHRKDLIKIATSGGPVH